MEVKNEMKGFLKDRKWQFLCMALAVALIISIGFNIYQSFSASANSLPRSDTNGQTNSTFTWLNFTFTWSPDSQRIVQGVFCLKISMGLTIGGEVVTIIIEANDDDYNEWDYIGLVFDTNQNGYIDLDGEDSLTHALYVNNMTQPAVLGEHGFLGFAEVPPKPNPLKVTFDLETGYIFKIYYPGYWELDPKTGEARWHGRLPVPTLKTGTNNPLHICFYDADGGKVFVRFLFYLPEE